MTATFRRFAGTAALLTAVVGVIYTVTFALYVRESYHWAHWASAIALTIGGLLAAPVLIGLRVQLRDAEPEFGALAALVGLVGVLGASIHGAHDVANLAKHVAGGGNANLPSEIDPRGFLTFALTGAGLGLFGWIILRTNQLPRLLGQTGIAAMVLLFVVYFGRLIALDPNKNVIRVAALAVGLIALPGFYLLIARAFLRE